MKKIITALASFGMSGEVFHGPLITACEGLELKYILQRSKDTAKDKYPQVTILKTFDEIIDNPEIELVVVNTPNQLHYPMTKAALEAGKHVVVEKPFTITSAEGEELIRLAKSKELILSVFHSKRFDNDFLVIKKILDEKALGEIVELELHYDRYRTHVTHKKWKEDNEPGSGTLYDLGVHLIDTSLQLFGKPQAVTADLRTLRKEAGSVDYFNLRLDYPNIRVLLKSSTLVKEHGPTIQLHGHEGSFIKYGTDPQELQLKNGMLPGDAGYGIDSPDFHGILHTENNGKTNRVYVHTPKGSYELYYENIYQAIRNKQSLLVKAEEALEAVKVVETAIRSFEEKRTIDFN